MIQSLQSIAGLFVFILIAWLLSENKRRFPVKVVIAGIILQFAIAVAMLRMPWASSVFMGLNDLVMAIDKASKAGSGFMFGYLGGAELPFAELRPGGSFIVAFQVLPIIIVMSALSAVLYHWGILQRVVTACAYVLRRTMNAGGAMGLGVAANVFLGIIESPLFIKPYLAKMNRSELFTVMTAGMASVAGTVMVLYASVLATVVPDAAGQILIASLISAPAGLLIAQIMIPNDSATQAGDIPSGPRAGGTMDALITGTMEGLQMTLGVAAVIIVLFACVSLINQALGLIPHDGTAWSVQGLFGGVFRPLVWLMGISWDEAAVAGRLMGTKTVLNEFVSYMEMAALPAGTLSERARLIMTYAMCGFANFGSLGILVGGLGTILPERRQEVIELGTRALISGTLATMMTGAVISLIV
jgi:CNT family concentrative nucleoside transporter